MERLPLAFIAKHSVCGIAPSPRCNSRYASLIAALLYKYAGVPNLSAAARQKLLRNITLRPAKPRRLYVSS